LLTAAIVEQFDVATSGNIVVTGAQVNINPIGLLASLTDYYVTIPSGAIEDLSGNTFGGFTDSATWNFTTLDASSDTIPPSLTGAFTPADNATAVSLTTNLVATFDEDISIGTGTIQLKDLATNGIIESFDVATSTNITISANQLSVDPTSDLVVDAEYYVVIDGGAIIDLAGNPFSGFTDNSTWNFATPITSSLSEMESLYSIQFGDNDQLTIVNNSGTAYSLRLILLSGAILKETSPIVDDLLLDLSSYTRGMIIIQLENSKGLLSKKIMLY
jgi:hypothetical protein